MHGLPYLTRANLQAQHREAARIMAERTGNTDNLVAVTLVAAAAEAVNTPAPAACDTTGSVDL